MTLNGHDRKEVYEYSIKKLFYFFEIIQKHKNKELYDLSVMNFNTLVSINSGDIKFFKSAIDELDI